MIHLGGGFVFGFFLKKSVAELIYLPPPVPKMNHSTIVSPTFSPQPDCQDTKREQVYTNTRAMVFTNLESHPTSKRPRYFL